MEIREESTQEAERSKIEDIWSMEVESSSNNEQTLHQDVNENDESVS
jgi:hypothetical protein